MKSIVLFLVDKYNHFYSIATSLNSNLYTKDVVSSNYQINDIVDIQLLDTVKKSSLIIYLYRNYLNIYQM